MELHIEVVDPIASRIPKKEAVTLIPCLSFDSEYWIKGQFGKKRKPHRKQFFFSKGQKYWYFYTGLLQKVASYCHLTGVDIVISNQSNAFPFELEAKIPHVRGKILREDQIELVRKATDEMRGIIKAPTGSGKTLLQMAIASCYPNFNILILAHTVSITYQTFKEFEEHGFKHMQLMGGGLPKELNGSRIVISTMQTFKKVQGYDDYFQVVMIDEAHHVTKATGTYGKILGNMLAPIRLGFTATIPTEAESQFTMEGLLGPVIGELTIQEAHDLGILATPKIKLVKSRFNALIKQQRNYQDVYSLGIVQNRSRNKQIVDLIDQYISEGKTILVIVVQIQHGILIQQMAERYNIPIEFVQGSTEGENREQIKKLLSDKKIPCVISTAVWREGVNIPSLDVVINAAGGKSEIMTLQSLGRGLRKTDDKDEVIIVDFFDPSHHYLISHFGERVTLYMDQGWL